MSISSSWPLFFILFCLASPILDAFVPAQSSTRAVTCRFSQEEAPWFAASRGDTARPQQGNRNKSRGPIQGNRPQQPRRDNRNPNNDNRGGQKDVFSSPHRKMNYQITQEENALDLLGLLASTKGALTSYGGGGSLNNINFSTACHRVARHLQYAFQQPQEEGNNRSRVLSDPRFALFICSSAEALLGGGDDIPGVNKAEVWNFGSRELCNIAWAVAKLKIAPPASVLPVDASSDVEEKLRNQCKHVRNMVYDVAKQRGLDSKAPTGTWIPALSELCGLLLDTISYRATHTLEPGKFQLQEFANLLWALATAQRGDPDVFAFVVDCLLRGAAEGGKELYSPQEWSNSIWALATSAISGPEEKLLPFLSDMIDSSSQFLSEFKPQELGNTAWGVAKILANKKPFDPESKSSKAALNIIRHVAQEVVLRAGREPFKSQELSNIAWSFATIGFGIKGQVASENTLNDYITIPSDDQAGDHKLVHDAMEIITQMAMANLPKFRSQELNNIAWASARLEYKNEVLFDAICVQISNRRRPVSAQDVSTTLWAFAQSEYFKDEAYRSLASRITVNRGQCRPQELSNSLWAIATAEVKPKYLDAFDDSLLPQNLRISPAQAEDDPVTVIFAQAAQELMRRPQEFKTQEIKDILWSFSKVGVRHPQLFKSVAEYLAGATEDEAGRGLNDFSPQGLGNMAWAFARQAQVAEDANKRHAGQTSLTVNYGRLAVYTTSRVDIGEKLLKRFFALIAETDVRTHNQLAKLRPQDLGNTAWAFAVLGLRHDEFLNAVQNQVSSRVSQYLNNKKTPMTRFKGQELANILWALATLNYPCQGLMHEVADYIVEICTGSDGRVTVASVARAFKRQELANIAWACAVLREYPPALIRILYLGIVGIGEKADPAYFRAVFEDRGIQQSEIMSLTYLQIAMDLDGAANGMALPADLPEAWDRDDTFAKSGSLDTMMDNDFNLRLTTSRIQRDVASAFGRIGFDFVDEHVIRMATLAEEFGVQMAASPVEILSMDIANVASKIGIEVDGPAHFVSLVDQNIPEDGAIKWVNGKQEYQFRWTGESLDKNGPTALNIRMLKQLGWRVINLPFWEWHALENDPLNEEEYCRRLLKSIE